MPFMFCDLRPAHRKSKHLAGRAIRPGRFGTPAGKPGTVNAGFPQHHEQQEPASNPGLPKRRVRAPGRGLTTNEVKRRRKTNAKRSRNHPNNIIGHVFLLYGSCVLFAGDAVAL